MNQHLPTFQTYAAHQPHIKPPEFLQIHNALWFPLVPLMFFIKK